MAYPPTGPEDVYVEDSKPLHMDNSTMAALAACDTRALLRYGHGWTSSEESFALQCGTAVHEALETYFKTSDRKQALKRFRAVYQEWAEANVPPVNEAATNWVGRYSFDNVRDILKTWLRRHPLDEEMYKVYPDLVEIGFSFPLDDETIFYGRYDAIVEEKQTGNFYVLDHKGQPLDAKILTPRGWTTMGALKINDEVMGVNGQPTKVVGIYPLGARDIYRVTFQDRSVTHCTGDHVWLTKKPQTAWKTRTLVELLADGGRHQIPVAAPVEFVGGDYLPVAPYMLGALLGDGCLRTGSSLSISASAEKAAVLERIRLLLPADVVMTKHKGKNHSWTLAGKRSGVKNSLIVALEALGVRGHLAPTKFVPPQYLVATIENRRALLQGLMDTDGFAYQGHLMYDSTSKQLAEDVMFLARSLGGMARYHVRKGTNYPCYRVSLRFPAGVDVFSLPRKRVAATVDRDRVFSRYIKSIESVGSAEAQCIRVAAADGLYITDDFIVTHNTTGQLSSDWAHTFKMSTQISGYTWAAMQLLGKPVTGAIINGIQISKLPDPIPNKDGTIRKCITHKIPIDECRLTHVRENLAITQRTPEQLAQWKQGAQRLAKRWRYLLKQYPTVESVSDAHQQGMFAGACRYCDFRSYCEVGRPADKIGQMLKYSPWKPFNPEEVKK